MGNKLTACTHSKCELFLYKNNPLCNGSSGVIYRGKKTKQKWSGYQVLKNVNILNTNIKVDDFAVKRFIHHTTYSYDMFIKEIKTLYELIDEPHIIKIIGYDKKEWSLVTELCEGGDLLDWYLQQKRMLTEEEVKLIVKQLIVAIGECHRHNIVHVDLKLENIGLLKKNDIHSIRLLDFNSAISINEYNPQELLHTSPHYTPPEIYLKTPLKSEHLKYIDYWELGIITYALLTGLYPFDGSDNDYIRLKIIEGRYDWPHNIDISDACKDFVKQLLIPEADKRLDIMQTHIWVD